MQVNNKSNNKIFLAKFNASLYKWINQAKKASTYKTETHCKNKWEKLTYQYILLNNNRIYIL